MTEYPIRRAQAGDRDSLLTLINTVWPSADGTPGRIEKRLPWLFTDERLGNHLVCTSDGRIIGVVGVYPLPAVLNGVDLDLVGIGQVITHPQYRGRGIMSALLREAEAIIDTGEFDGSWLHGKYERYARSGWGLGGHTLLFRLDASRLASLPVLDGITPLAPDEAFDVACDHVRTLANRVRLSDDELRARLAIEEAHGWRVDDSFVLLDRAGTGILFARGDADTIAGLLAHHARGLGGAGGDALSFTCEQPSAASPLMTVCRAFAAGVRVEASFGFRIGGLVRLMKKVLERPDVPIMGPGEAEVGIEVRETGESATIRVVDGCLAVRDGAADPHRLARHEIAELLFGLLPPDAYVPTLTRDHPLARVLPVRIHLPWILRDVV